MLWDIGNKKSVQGVITGELLPLTNKDIVVNQNGIDFIVNIETDNMKIKHSPGVAMHDPFLSPYSPTVFINDICLDHVCILNKFPIVVPHLLICAKDYIPQTSPLILSDFKAWVEGISDSGVLGFFNSGAIAGSSQMHRHMQLIRTSLPLESAILKGLLPFKHELLLLDDLNPEHLYQQYLAVMDKMQLYTSSTVNGLTECLPYNILLTNRWMLIIPRTTNEVGTVKGHGVNFIGRFLVSLHEQLQWLTNYGFMHFLTDCGVVNC
ncbi:phosphorylase [Photobacterium leiognathi]|uniref:phosphorylase n=1 Tax=Photobacterium leiognathi TaxID=553611 RepID=UPI002736728B|nr:phosphorylase [Photobacterium leiognathi]